VATRRANVALDVNTYAATVGQEQHQLPLFLTVGETAGILRTTSKAIYAMVERGQLPGVTRVGRRLLVRSQELLHSLDHSRTPSSGGRR